MDTPEQAKSCLRVIHLEDDPNDAELIESFLKEHQVNCSIAVVDTKEAFEASIQKGEVDLILSDSKLPGFDTMSAMIMAKEQIPNVPFIFVSGTVSPRTKADAFLKGASDFIGKDNLPKLARVINWIFFSNKRKDRHPLLPEAGAPVMVQCPGFRCLAYMGYDGKWRDFGGSSELPDVIEWFEL